MADDFRLLLKAVAAKQPARHDLVSVFAEGMAGEGQEESSAFLRLPDVGHFMDEEALGPQRLFRKIVGPEIALRMEVDVAARRHGRVLRLERPPFAADQPDVRIIDGVAEHRSRQIDFASRQGAGLSHRHCDPG